MRLNNLSIYLNFAIANVHRKYRPVKITLTLSQLLVMVLTMGNHLKGDLTRVETHNGNKFSVLLFEAKDGNVF